MRKYAFAAVVICFWISNCRSTGFSSCCDGMSAKLYTEGHETDIAIQEPEVEVNNVYYYLDFELKKLMNLLLVNYEKAFPFTDLNKCPVCLCSVL